MKNIVLVLLCACVFLAPDRAQSQEPDKAAELKSVLQEWQKRRESTESVLYEVIGKATVVKGYLSSDPSGPKMKGPVPAADYTFPLKIKWLLNFRKNWVRKETFNQSFYNGERWIDGHETIFFDGKDLKVFTPRADNPYPPSPDLTIQTKAFSHLVFSYIDFPVFFAHGVVPTSKSGPVAVSLMPRLEPDQFRIHGFGLLNQNKHLVIRTVAPKGTFHEYWIDPNKEGSIARAVTYSAGLVFVQIDIQHQKTQWGWLPKKWEVSSYLSGGEKPDWLEVVEVQDLMVNPPTKVGDFQIDASPDFFVHDVKSGRIIGKSSPINWWLYSLIALALVCVLLLILKRKGYLSGRKGP